MTDSNTLKFGVDRSLGKLCKWLRLLGFDTLYQAAMTDTQFMEMLQQGRILVTRNHSMFKEISGSAGVFIRYNKADKQLTQVVKELKIRWMDVTPFSRCLRCNEVIESIEREKVYGKVPDYVFETQLKFTTCRQCQRIFWPGTHIERSIKHLKDLFNTIYSKNTGDSA